jgi:hypothetical protein
LLQQNKEGKFIMICELEKNLDTNFSVLFVHNFHIKDWEEQPREKNFFLQELVRLQNVK